MELRSVITRLNALSRRIFLRITLSGGSLILAGVCCLVLVTFLLDFLLHLPTGVRGVLLALAFGILAWLTFKHLLRPLARKPGIDQLALAAEAADPTLGDQLISAIQLERDLETGRAVESPELIRATIADTARRFGKHSFKGAVDLGPCKKPMAMATLGVAVIVGLGAAFPDHAKLWIDRQILLRSTPWPQKNTLVIEIVDIEKFGPTEEHSADGRLLSVTLHVPERTSLHVRVTAAPGKTLPDDVELITSGEDGRERPIEIGRTRDQEFFQHIFSSLARSIQFHARGGDDRDGLPVYRINVNKAPRITSFQASYHYPQYTGLEDQVLPDANINAPEGTRIIAQFRTNMPLSEFSLNFDSIGPQKLSAKEDGSYSYSFVLQGNDFYTYEMKGTNGVSSAAAARYVITSVADQEPRVQVEMPAFTSLLVTPDATVPLKGVASDDYGVTWLGLRWGEGREKLDDGELALSDTDLLEPLGKSQVPFFKAMEVKALLIADRSTNPPGPARAVKEGDNFAFKFLVADNRKTPAEPEPHRAFGDYEYRVQVLSRQDLERELAQRQIRLKGRVKDISTLIDARIDDTRKLIASLDQPSGDDDKMRQSFWRLEQDQNRITLELLAGTRDFRQAFDGYLWNRLNPGFLTEKLIQTLTELHRTRTDQEIEPARIYGQAVEAVRPQINEAEVMGRLTIILDLLLRTSMERSPEAQARISRAGLVTSPEERVTQLDGALEMQERLRQDVLVLVDKLEAWEDFLDVIQGVRDLLEVEQGVQKKIEKITK